MTMKANDPELISRSRPIVYCIFMYKINPRIWLHRRNSFFQILCTPTKFVTDQQIHENIIIAPKDFHAL